MIGFLTKNHYARLLELANTAFNNNEVPISAIIIDSTGTILVGAYNTVSSSNSVHNHAEINAINKLFYKLKINSLKNYRMISTLEPCLMCLGAIFHSQLDSVEYICKSNDGSFSKFENLYPIMYQQIGNNKQKIIFKELLENFFKILRDNKNEVKKNEFFV
ncbi:nucleoside deaminase [Spiroplasma endosymbiont of Labia minor]|uniref:nucleoside deaminase n=1 Tax=Spiroplasma endosymbiont of Labia minor TaxID=3066305 RepID=UPI0030D0D3DB